MHEAMHLVAIDENHSVAFHESGIGGGAIWADVANDRRASRIDAELRNEAVAILEDLDRVQPGRDETNG